MWKGKYPRLLFESTLRVPLSVINIYFKTMIESGVEDYINETKYILACKEINYKVCNK